MKLIIIFVFGFIALTSGLVVSKKLLPTVTYATAEFLQKQKFILDVLDQIYQPLQDPKYLQDATNYVTGAEYYTNYTPVQEFIKLYEYGVIPKNYVYSILDNQLLRETVGLFNLFYYAKDYPTFYKNVLWARQNINEQMFVYALSVAVVHRKDMEGIILPALQEIVPNFFFTSEVMSAAANAPVTNLAKTVYKVQANYTDIYEKLNEESVLAYFTEDIGWNSYNYYFHIDYPFWMGGPEFNLYKDRRGELYLYVHQQILARYYLERLSNGLGAISKFSWLKPIKTGYNPHLRYYNGLEFSSRKNYYDVTAYGDYNTLSLVQDYERRIRDIIDLGYYTLPTGERIDMRNTKAVEFLGNMIQGNPDSAEKQFIDYMTLLAKVLLGGSTYKMTNDYKVQPSVLEHFETAMRDPVFYQLYNKVIMYYSQLKNYLRPYTYDDLLLPDVTIQDVTVSPLITYFDNYDSDITNGVNIPLPNTPLSMTYNNTSSSGNLNILTPFGNIMKKILPPPMTGPTPVPQPMVQQQTQYKIVAKQQRLNHKPFTLSVNVSSSGAHTVIVRAFLGPKLDEYKNVISLTENRDNFVQIDQFVYSLPGGNVTITRNSKDFFYSVKDRTSYTDLYKKVMKAIIGSKPFPLDMSEAHCGFPDRLLLPKGWIEGMPVIVYVIITPYTMNTAERQFSTYDYTKSCGVGSGSRYIDDQPLSYPFDRAIDETAYTTPNMFFKDVIIYHTPSKSSGPVSVSITGTWAPYGAPSILSGSKNVGDSLTSNNVPSKSSGPVAESSTSYNTPSKSSGPVNVASTWGPYYTPSNTKGPVNVGSTWGPYNTPSNEDGPVNVGSTWGTYYTPSNENGPVNVASTWGPYNTPSNVNGPVNVASTWGPYYTPSNTNGPANVASTWGPYNTPSNTNGAVNVASTWGPYNTPSKTSGPVNVASTWGAYNTPSKTSGPVNTVNSWKPYSAPEPLSIDFSNPSEFSISSNDPTAPKTISITGGPPGAPKAINISGGGVPGSPKSISISNSPYGPYTPYYPSNPYIAYNPYIPYNPYNPFSNPNNPSIPFNPKSITISGGPKNISISNDPTSPKAISIASANKTISISGGGPGSPKTVTISGPPDTTTTAETPDYLNA